MLKLDIIYYYFPTKCGAGRLKLLCSCTVFGRDLVRNLGQGTGYSEFSWLSALPPGRF